MILEKYDKENLHWNEKYTSMENTINRYKEDNGRLLDKVNKFS